MVRRSVLRREPQPHGLERGVFVLQVLELAAADLELVLGGVLRAEQNAAPGAAHVRGLLPDGFAVASDRLLDGGLLLVGRVDLGRVGRRLELAQEAGLEVVHKERSARVGLEAFQDGVVHGQRRGEEVLDREPARVLGLVVLVLLVGLVGGGLVGGGRVRA